MSLSFGIFTSYNGTLIADYSGRVRDLQFNTNEHGFAALTCFVPLSLAESFMLYDRPGLPHVLVSDNGATVWEGRLEDVSIINGGVRLGAFGYWRAFSDTTYTAFWSKDTTEDFEPLTSVYASTLSVPEMYSMDTNNRVQISLNKSASYRNNNDYGVQMWTQQASATRKITYLSYSYDYKLPANWRFRVDAFDAAATCYVVASPITNIGGSAVGTCVANLSSSPRECIAFSIFNFTGASYLNSAESGSQYGMITNLRITSSGSTIYADEVVKHILSTVNTLNACQINSSSALIESPSLDLTRLNFEDQVCTDALTYLASLGDNQSNIWEVGVYENQFLHFRERASAGRSWMIDVSALEVERTLNEMYNSLYAVYTDQNSDTQRTSACTDNDSVTRYGVTRKAAYNAPTSSSTLAISLRDTSLADVKTPIPRITIQTDRLFDDAGSLWPLWSCRSGDTITIRNLPPSLSTEIDRIRTFRVAETEYNADNNTIRITPERPTPRLEVIVAQREATGQNK